MAEQKDGCVKPSKGPILNVPENSAPSQQIIKEVSMTQARVGKTRTRF